MSRKANGGLIDAPATQLELLRMRVATYTRISTDEDHQPYSLDAQAQRLDSYIASQDGWERVRTFSDQCSGATLERSALQRALREARAGRFDLLLVYRVDRLARSVRGLAQILEELDRAGVAFRSATEPFDTATSAGRMMVQMLGVFAEFERATIVDRVLAGMERKAQRGGWNGGTIPYGYGYDSATGFLSVNAEEAPLVPVIFGLYARRRLGSKAVAAWLNRRGHRTREGRLWSPDRVLSVLRNRAYLGEVFFRGDSFPAPHPALVSRDVFADAQAVVEERREERSMRRSNPSDYLLAGVVVCDRCGGHYIGTAAHGRSARYRYYTCLARQRYGTGHCDADRLPARDLEAAVVEALDAVYARTDLVDQAIAAAAGGAEQEPKIHDQMAQVAADLARTEAAIERYLLAFESGSFPEAQCGERVRTLSQRATELRCRQGELQAALDDAPAPTITGADIAALRTQLCAVLTDPSAEPSVVKALLRLLIAEIRVVSRDAIQPTFRIPLDPVRVEAGVVRPEGLEPPLPAPEAGALSN